MAANSKIEWTDHTFNAWVGCTKVGPGCDGCYAESWAARAGRDVWGPGKPRERTTPANWKQPLKWNAEAEAEGVRRFVFCNSLADVFDNEVPNIWRVDLFRLIAQTPHLTWLLLTKRVGNVKSMMTDLSDRFVIKWPANAWLGATIVNQPEADRDVGKLLQTKLRLGIPRVFLSIEPQVGPVDLVRVGGKSYEFNALHSPEDPAAAIDWVISGGETGRGPATRPQHPHWPRILRDQCAAFGVQFFHKQNGEWVRTAGKQEGRTFTPDIKAGDIWMREDGLIGDGKGRTDRPPRVWAPREMATMRRVGRAAAGRLLDGVEHNGRPPA